MNDVVKMLRILELGTRFDEFGVALLQQSKSAQSATTQRAEAFAEGAGETTTMSLKNI